MLSTNSTIYPQSPQHVRFYSPITLCIPGTAGEGIEKPDTCGVNGRYTHLVTTRDEELCDTVHLSQDRPGGLFSTTSLLGPHW